MSGADLTHIQYKGAGAFLVDIAGGQISMSITALTATLPFVQTGRMRALGVASSARSPALPDVPTIAEAGVAGYSTGSWLGLVGPAGLPAEIVATLNKVVHQTLAEPATVERLRKAGSDVVPTTPQAFKARLESDVNKWTEVVSTAGIPRI
jgi:tripartite-type tricarboxylate transporter receptor subunit TctC